MNKPILSRIILTLTLLLSSIATFAFPLGDVKAQIADSPWPMFHHDFQHTGRSPYLGSQTNDVRWSYTTGGIVYSSPAIGSDGTIYVGSEDYSLYAISDNGSLKWSFPTGGVVRGAPAIGSDGTIYVGSIDYNFYAINPNGTYKWSYYADHTFYSSPAIGSDGTIYVGTRGGALNAINPNGTLKWSYPTSHVISSPAIGSDGTVYVGSDDGKLYAINPDGSLKWSYTAGGIVESSPAIGGDGTIYVGSNDGKLYAISDNGTLKWSYTTGGAVSSSPAIGNDGTVYVGSSDNNTYAINPNGSFKWSYTTGGSIGSSPAIGSDGTIYIGSNDGKLYAISDNSSLKWSCTTGGVVHSSPAIGSDGTVYVGSGDNNLYALHDTVGITVNPTSGLVTTEAGGTANFTVVLNTQPSANVTIGLSSNDTSEGTVSPASLTFTSANWNTSQTVTVTGVDDVLVDGNVAYTIVTAAAVSSDINYNGFNAADVSVTNNDNDTVGITVNPTSGLVTTEAGGTANFTVVLNTQPSANVTIGLSSNDTSEGMVSPASLTFTSANWNTSQTVTVTGVDDVLVDGNVAYTIVTAAAVSSDINYNGFNAADVSVTNNDNDTVGITVNPTSGLVTTEAGGTANFTVVLNTQPSANVTIGLSSNDTSEGMVSPASLTFTSANWNTSQTVTVTGVDDVLVDGNVAYTIVTAAAVSSDINYNGFNAADVSVTNNDNDGSAPQAIEDLISQINALGLDRGIGNSLVQKLEAAIRSLDRGQTNAAENQLKAFINQVNALKGKKISNLQASDLIDIAQNIVDSL